MPSRRTTHRSTSGTKLYAVRDKHGKFKDIELYSRAHRQDIQRVSAAEKAERKRKGLPPRVLHRKPTRRSATRKRR
jgi:hypothetical protein